MMAIMGLSGFGKRQKKRTLDPSRFDKTKRVVEVNQTATYCQSS